MNNQFGIIMNMKVREDVNYSSMWILFQDIWQPYDTKTKPGHAECKYFTLYERFFFFQHCYQVKIEHKSF